MMMAEIVPLTGAFCEIRVAGHETIASWSCMPGLWMQFAEITRGLSCVLVFAIRHEITEAAEWAGDAACSVHKFQYVTTAFLRTELFGDDDVGIARESRA